MFQFIPYLVSEMYQTGKAQPIKSGKWTVDNLYEGQPTLYIIVRRNGEIVADAVMDKDTVDGVKNLEMSDPLCGHSTKRKIVDLIRAWVKKNREMVYPS